MQNYNDDKTPTRQQQQQQQHQQNDEHLYEGQCEGSRRLYNNIVVMLFAFFSLEIIS